MNKRKDHLAVVTMFFMCLTTIPGILSMNFSHAYDFVNQYGHKVALYGFGIYAKDSY